jgi:Zn-dependent peptidase ImmA (M78 family)
MDNIKIKFAVLEVFEKCNIKSFPIDCIQILESYNLKVKPYSTQSPAKKEMCLKYSEDAFCIKRTVYYNDNKIIGRIRFSLAHEIGHKVLKHTEPSTIEQEKEADCFASHLLAPRMAIHYSGCKNLADVAKQFNMTNEAAQYAFDDYRRWHRKVIYKMEEIDKLMYNHFYNEELHCFVFNIKPCSFCGEEIYNSKSDYCVKCFNRLSYIDYRKDDFNFLVAESNWLYGGL